MYPTYKGLVLLLTALCTVATGCRKAGTTATQADAAHFSIRQFASDQFKSFRGTPFVMEKEMVLNDRKDSAVVNSYQADWEPILKTFLATDISDGRFTDQYEISVFNDGAGANVLYYTALKDKLLTRTLQVRVDAFTNRILSLYVETERHSFWNTTKQKLYYAPMKLIQIQEHSDPLIGKAKSLRIEYRFML